MGLPSLLAISNFPWAAALVAMSSRKGWPLRVGTATAMGLVPSMRPRPKVGATKGGLLVRASPIMS